MFHSESMPSRREAMRLAAAGVAGVSLSGWLAPLAAQAASKTHRACIVLWMDGGPSHIEMFDPKPNGKAEVRGSLGAIRTAVPGIQICEKFPMLAARMKDLAILRGMTTEEPDHARGRLYMKVLGIDAGKTIDAPGGRPVKIGEKGANHVAELFS